MGRPPGFARDETASAGRPANLDALRPRYRELYREAAAIAQSSIIARARRAPPPAPQAAHLHAREPPVRPRLRRVSRRLRRALPSLVARTAAS